jgi:hypothetical protein
MLEQDLIQTRGFHNIRENGKITGFQVALRLTYYRGVFLSQLRPQKLVVDGETFPREDIVWNVKGKDYTFEQMKHESAVLWSPSEAAYLKIKKEGGLSSGYHEVSTGYKYSSSYLPPAIQADIDSDCDSPILSMLFGQLKSTRKLLMV